MLLTFPFKWDLFSIFQPFKYDELLDYRWDLLTTNLVNHNFTPEGIAEMDNVEFEYYINKLIEITRKQEEEKLLNNNNGGIING